MKKEVMVVFVVIVMVLLLYSQIDTSIDFSPGKVSSLGKMSDFFKRAEVLDTSSVNLRSSAASNFVCRIADYFPTGSYPRYSGCFGDVDGNGFVNAGDRGFVAANIGQTSNDLICKFDLDGNGEINSGDRGIVSANMGSCADLPDYQSGSGLNHGVPDERFGFANPDSYCGDGEISFGEYCDDGNNNDFDGCSASCGREIYVDKENRFGAGCNNNWPGTQEQPKCNINQNWFQRNLEPGDSIVIREASSYPEMRFYVESSGTAEKPIEVKAWPGEEIIIDGSIIAGPHGVRFIGGASHIHITGPIEISNHGYSIYTEYPGGVGSSRDITIKDCSVHNTQHGPRFENAEDVIIRNCEVFDISVNGVQLRNSRNIFLENLNVHHVDDGRSPDNSDADGFHSYGGENIVCKRCSSWANSEDGFDFNANVEIIDSLAYENSGAGIKAWRRVEDDWAEKTVVVKNSRIYDNGYYAPDSAQGNPGIKVSMGAGLKVYNSVVYGNYDQGIKVRWDDDDAPYNLGLDYQTVEIYNTIIGGAMNGPGLVEDSYPNGELTIANNNLYFDNFGGDVSGIIAGQNDVFANPLFVNLVGGDFRLGIGSPAIDAGRIISGFHCQNGQTNGCMGWSGNAPDIGFDERGLINS